MKCAIKNPLFWFPSNVRTSNADNALHTYNSCGFFFRWFLCYNVISYNKASSATFPNAGFTGSPEDLNAPLI